jgi:hypothetical protein
MKKQSPKVVQMPAPRVERPAEPLTEADWERIAEDIFAERKKDNGRMPDRRRPPVPVWYPPHE